MEAQYFPQWLEECEVPMPFVDSAHSVANMCSSVDARVVEVVSNVLEHESLKATSSSAECMDLDTYHRLCGDERGILLQSHEFVSSSCSQCTDSIRCQDDVDSDDVAPALADDESDCESNCDASTLPAFPT